jgi:CHASE1-domain containing sensor protein
VVEHATGELERAALGLRGARGYLMGAGVDEVNTEGFRAYFETRDLAREFPGVMGIGFIRRVAPQAEQDFVAHARQHGWPDYAVRKLGAHAGERRLT